MPRIVETSATSYFSYLYAVNVYMLDMRGDLDDVVTTIGQVGISGTWRISLSIEHTSNRSDHKGRPETRRDGDSSR
jgi:hypothetical protein